MNQKFYKLLENILESTESNTFQDFLETRRKGAQNNASTAKEKGGLALLSYQHFKAKDVPYKKAIKKANNEKRDSYYQEEAEKCLAKLKSWKTMSQKEFQTVMGELEVWGEVYLKSKGK